MKALVNKSSFRLAVYRAESSVSSTGATRATLFYFFSSPFSPRPRVLLFIANYFPLDVCAAPTRGTFRFLALSFFLFSLVSWARSQDRVLPPSVTTVSGEEAKDINCSEICPRLSPLRAPLFLPPVQFRIFSLSPIAIITLPSLNSFSLIRYA